MQLRETTTMEIFLLRPSPIKLPSQHFSKLKKHLISQTTLKRAAVSSCKKNLLNFVIR